MITNLIEKRRSIRSYTLEVPPEEWIDEMLACVCLAPSPSNRQPVRMALIQSDDKRKIIKNAMTKGKDILMQRVEQRGVSQKLKNWIRTYFRYSKFMFQAPWLFAAGIAEQNDDFTKHLASAGLLDRIKTNQSDNQIALGISINHFLLKATDLGLGTCVLTAPLVFLTESNVSPFLHGMDLKCFITAGFPSLSEKSKSRPVRKHASEIFFKV